MCGNIRFFKTNFKPSTKLAMFVLALGFMVASIGCNRSSTQPSLMAPLRVAELFNQRGNAYLRAEELNPAIHSYTEAIRIDPNFAVAYCNRGNVFVRRGDPDLAVNDLNIAVQLQPDLGEAFYIRATAWEMLGDSDQADKDLRQAKLLGYEPPRMIVQPVLDVN